MDDDNVSSLDRGDEEARRAAQVEDAMRAQGVPVEERVQEDYFGFEDIRNVFLPDGISFISHRVMNEGKRRQYLKMVNRDIRVQRTGDAYLKSSPGEDRYALLRTAICGWNLQRNGVPVPFSERSLNDWLEVANPRIVELVEKDIRMSNPWLLQDLSLEDIDNEIKNLQDLRERKVEEEEGNAGSSTK